MSIRTHITVLLDRTGSMQDIRADVVGGFNSFLAAQQSTDAPGTFTLVQFDSQDPYEVLRQSVPIASMRPLALEHYQPRASTPLYDAMGRGILDLELQLAQMAPAACPQKIFFVVVTDGHENASTSFDRARVMALVAAKQALGWEFVFLSADLTAFDDAGRLGIHRDARLAFKKSKQGSDHAWDSVSEKVLASRSYRDVHVRFDDADRKKQDDAK